MVAARQIFFIAVLFFVSDSMHGQGTARDVLRQKTEHRLQQMVQQSPAVTGLVVVDLKSGKTNFSFNPDVEFPQASAIKIPILMEVYKQAKAGKFSLSDQSRVTPDSIVGGTGVIKNMKPPLQFTIQNLCALMISLSDNTATNVLIDLVGMNHVNATMRSLGLEHTILRRKMMDTKASAGGRENISTPKEAARILGLLYSGKFISKDVSSAIVEVLKKPARRESRLAARVPNSVPIAFKPGELNGVSTEWAMVLLRKKPYAVAIMESYKPDTQSRVVENISSLLYRYYWRMGNATKFGTYANKKWR